jgi:amidohydrolase
MATPAALTSLGSTNNGYRFWLGQAAVTAARRSVAASAGTVLAMLLEAVGQEVPTAVALRRELHASPEVGGYEIGTASRVAAALGESGVPSATTGRLVRIGAASGPSVAIRAELDALPLTEQTPVAWASQNGASHSCGHDVHLAALTAAGRAVRGVGGPLPLVALLQPREESQPSGAQDLVGSPQLEAQDVRAMIAAHVHPHVACGQVSVGPGPVNAAYDEVTITIRGRGGHAAYPHVTRDPVIAAAHVILALQHLISRRTDPMHSAVLTIGAVQAGAAANVIPEQVVLTGSLRTFEPADRASLRSAVGATAGATAEAYECTAQATFTQGEPVLDNDAALAAAAAVCLTQAGFRVVESLRSCGSDDFAYYCTRYPSLMMFVGVGQPGGTDTPGLHHPAFLPREEAVGDVARAMLAGYVAACSVVLPGAPTRPTGAPLTARGSRRTATGSGPHRARGAGQR